MLNQRRHANLHTTDIAVQIIFIIVGFFLLGFIARKFINEPSTLVKWLNNFIIYLALPSLILLKVPDLAISAEMVIPAGVAWAWVLVGSLSVLALSRWQGWPRNTEGAMLLLVTMCNSSFLGFPMILAFFDDAVLAYAIFFDQLGGFLILSTFGLTIIAVYTPSSATSSHELVSLRMIVKRVVTFPPFIALLIALFAPIDSILQIANPFLSLLSEPLMPMALFVLGVQFQPKLLPEHRVPLSVAIGLKMIVAPLFGVAVLMTMGISGDVRTATVFELAMPSMMTPGLMAIHAGIAPRFVATLLGYSTVFAFISLPIVAWCLA